MNSQRNQKRNQKEAEGFKKTGILDAKTTFWNLNALTLIEKTILTGQGPFTNTGALACSTGKFTGQSPIQVDQM